jgi:hypothetical protein
MSEIEQIDGEFGLDYQLIILRGMIGSLPDSVKHLLDEQLDKVVTAMTTKNALIKDSITRELGDIRLNVLSLEFDRESTKRERDGLQKKLDDT